MCFNTEKLRIIPNLKEPERFSERSDDQIAVLLQLKYLLRKR